MIKYFCDRCGKETDGVHICEDCEHKELTCGFKVGDQVITSTGEVGHIDRVCTCERCKERGFYEPHVEVEIGVGGIYLTDEDKRSNFCSFYKIGDRVFGNIDEAVVEDYIERANSQITELEEQLKQYHMQLDVIKCMKNREELWDGN